MPTESAQMLSTVLRQQGLSVGYESTHEHHRCTRWVGASLSNWNWLVSLISELNKEWQYRFNHTINHKAYDVTLSLPTPNLPDLGLTPFAQAMPEEYRETNPVAAYRRFYLLEKSKHFKWTKRSVPSFIYTNF